MAQSSMETNTGPRPRLFERHNGSCARSVQAEPYPRTITLSRSQRQQPKMASIPEEAPLPTKRMLLASTWLPGAGLASTWPPGPGRAAGLLDHRPRDPDSGSHFSSFGKSLAHRVSTMHEETMDTLIDSGTDTDTDADLDMDGLLSAPPLEVAGPTAPSGRPLSSPISIPSSSSPRHGGFLPQPYSYGSPGSPQFVGGKPRGSPGPLRRAGPWPSCKPTTRWLGSPKSRVALRTARK